MSIKSDRWIRRMAREHKMIEPFADSQVREGVISYGVSSYGYDMRIADEFKIFTNNQGNFLRRPDRLPAVGCRLISDGADEKRGEAQCHESP
jgi:deoxycytidine triphosphate deaminase